MATGRLLQKKISHSDQVDALSDDTCRLCFTWSLAHLVYPGCFYASAKKIKALVVPLRVDISIDMVEGYVKEWEAQKLVARYQVNGDDFLFYPNFLENQPGLRANREGKSSIPRPPDDFLQQHLPESLWEKVGLNGK
jgi:hypothetical protein